MARLNFQGREAFSRDGETVLDALLRQGIDISFSCRNGACHTCMQRCTEGEIPAIAQRSLRPELRDQGYFLPCKCVPLTDMVISPPTQPRTTDNKSLAHDENKPAAASANGDQEKYPPPDPELWLALREGELLMEVLKDFYGRVFQDSRLSSFFHGVTMQRSIEKQYLFMRQILTGEKIFFGDRPRNSHHWMVISDELFDYRAELMASCLREHGLSAPMVRRFRGIEEFYRADIVKSAAFPRVMGDVEVPFEGFDEVVLDVGSLCDSCEREVAAGEKIIYHVRLGKIHCSDCSSRRNPLSTQV